METVQWDNTIFFKGLDNPDLADALMAKLKEYIGSRPPVAHINYRKFVDGELDDVFADHKHLEGKTIVFFECLKNESTMLRLLQLCWSAKNQYGVHRIIIVASFFHYRRQDRPEKVDEIQRNRWFVEMLKHNGVDQLIVATPHSTQTEYNCSNNDILFRAADPSEAFASVLRPLLPEGEDCKRTVVYAPDEGSIPRAIALAKFLGIDVLFNLKNRDFSNESRMIDADKMQIGEVVAKYDYSGLYYATEDRIKDAYVIMVEDEVDTGGTANRQGQMLREYGAYAIFFCVTHAVCSDGWKRKLLANNPFTKIIMCDTINRSAEQRTGGMVHDVSIAGLLASAVFRVLQKVT
jgi:ribose-phosphate pyrophosphokinase